MSVNSENLESRCVAFSINCIRNKVIKNCECFSTHRRYPGKVMSTEFSIDTINDYFTKLNPIATKISLDIDETKSAYEHIWAKLNPNEHNEIINETLMKPEISLRYFDNFSITASVSSLSLSSIVTRSQGEEANKIVRQAPHHHHHNLATRRFYGFDGRNLSTYAEQKVGLKLVHDEAFGTFRDGHSMPFSYKTKSQINLRIFQEEEGVEQLSQQRKDGFAKQTPKQKDPKVNVAEPEGLEISTETFKKLQSELATNLSNRNKSEAVLSNNTVDIGQDLKSFDKIDTKYKRFYDESQTASGTNPASIHSELSLLKLISKNGKSAPPKFHHSKYGYNGDVGDDDDEYERVNLMMNCCSNSAGGMTTSSSSAPSEDDEKTLCEDLKLLIDNDGLRKGFDFLNNW